MLLFSLVVGICSCTLFTLLMIKFSSFYLFSNESKLTFFLKWYFFILFFIFPFGLSIKGLFSEKIYLCGVLTLNHYSVMKSIEDHLLYII